MRVLVTGSNGFVGHWLLRHLRERGDEVITLPDHLDIRDREALADQVAGARPQGVIHLAAQASVPTSWEDPVTTMEVNTGGTLNLLEAVAAADQGTRVVLVSSAEVYGIVPTEELPVSEDRLFAPVSPYAASKAAAELVGLQHWLGRRLPVLAARPFNHTGPGQRPEYVVPGLARQVADVATGGSGGEGEGEHARVLRTGNLEVRRDITDVRDVVRAYRLLLDAGEPGQAYNVCSGHSQPIGDIARRLLAIAGVDVPIVVDPARARAVDQPDVRGDPQRLHRATGWVPEIALDETLTDVLAWWTAARTSVPGP